MRKPSRGRAVDVEKVIELYKEGISMNEIGRRLGHHHGVIGYHLHKSNLPIRKTHLRNPQIPTDFIEKLYLQGMGTTEIAEKVGLSAQAIGARLIKADTPMRTGKEAASLAYKRGRFGNMGKEGKDSLTWKGGRGIDKDGYVWVSIGGGKTGAEHRLVWEKHHGEIQKGWIVHHLNGSRDDNRIENLCAMPRKRHSPTLIIESHQKRIRELESQVYDLKKEVKWR